MFIDCLPRKPELRDYKSPEKDIIKEKFNTIPYMDIWICSIIEGYIYDTEEFEYLKDEEESDDEETYDEYADEINYFCSTRYGIPNGKYTGYIIISKDDETEVHEVLEEGYFKDGKRDGECKEWWDNNTLKELSYYKEGKLEGEYKMWHRGQDGQSENGQISYQQYYKDDKKE